MAGIPQKYPNSKPKLLFTKSPKKEYLVCKTLKEYQEILEQHHFLRTHQSHLINCRKIAAYIKTDGGYISMTDGSSVPISRQKRDEVLKRIL